MEPEIKVNVPDDLKKWLETPGEHPRYETSAELQQYWFEKGCVDTIKGTVDCELLRMCSEYFIGSNYAKTVFTSIAIHANTLFPNPHHEKSMVPWSTRVTGTFPGDSE